MGVVNGFPPTEGEDGGDVGFLSKGFLVGSNPIQTFSRESVEDVGSMEKGK